MKQIFYSAMIILGIDPGYGRMGYAVIEGERDRWKALDFGCVHTSAGKPFVERLRAISSAVADLCARFRPDKAAVEQLFFSTNQKTAIDVSQARGAIVLTLTQAGLPVYEYTPLQVKQAITGYGTAEKRQVAHMVCILLGMKPKSLQDDAADALAVALTCHRSGERQFAL